MVINLTEIIAEKTRKNKLYSAKEIREKGYSALKKLPTEEQGFIVELLMQYIIKEVEIGRGVVTPDKPTETPFFDRIDDVYRDSVSDCYFCAGTEIDPRETPFTKDTVVCPQCQLKLASYQRLRNTLKPKLTRKAKQTKNEEDSFWAGEVIKEMGKSAPLKKPETIPDTGDFENKIIEVCSSCKRACCRYSYFMCKDSRLSNTEKFTVKELRAMNNGTGNNENEKYWSDGYMEEVFSEPAPFGYKK